MSEATIPTKGWSSTINAAGRLGVIKASPRLGLWINQGRPSESQSAFVPVQLRFVFFRDFAGLAALLARALEDLGGFGGFGAFGAFGAFGGLAASFASVSMACRPTCSASCHI